ncbi:beta-ketoacyl-ACP synthase III [Pseudoroseicyclus sp. CXY001]|uniref:beta-ketoacyl-ACP synthase III n=1 Tax=Pseudoroseicyclus sp. CXY001 TaxID=3242492 RepID=UPI00358DD198
MPTPVITGKGVFTPEDVITNDELVASFNAYATAFNEANAAAIAAGEVAEKPLSSAAFITQASGIERRHVIDKAGVLDPARMAPRLPGRADEEPSLMAEIALKAARPALEEAGLAPESLGAILCAASNMERPYPAMAVEIQALLGAGGFAFDMNVACSSATFAIQVAADMIRAGTIPSALIVSPEITSGHLEWRDRDCHFIFGDVATALVIEADAATGFAIRSTKAATQFSNNIRNNNGFLRRAHDQMEDRRDMQFVQNGRKVFKEVLPLVSAHVESHLAADGTTPDQLKRLWLHQANKAMNDYIGRKVLGREPEPGEQPNILQEYANTSSAGSIIAFAQTSGDLAPGERGLICSFGAGYSVGSVIVERL